MNKKENIKKAIKNSILNNLDMIRLEQQELTGRMKVHSDDLSEQFIKDNQIESMLKGIENEVKKIRTMLNLFDTNI